MSFQLYPIKPNTIHGLRTKKKKKIVGFSWKDTWHNFKEVWRVSLSETLSKACFCLIWRNMNIKTKLGQGLEVLDYRITSPGREPILHITKTKSEILPVLSLSPVGVDKGATTKAAAEVGLWREQERNGNPIIILFSTPFKTQKPFTNWPFFLFFFKSVKYIQVTRFLN